MTTPERLRTDPDAARNLGFGTQIAGNSLLRLINKNGTFNVRRRGLSTGATLSPYHALLSMTWKRFLGLVLGSYLTLNALFAMVYVYCGPGALAGPRIYGVSQPTSDFLRAFFFSVETFGTIGYGHVSPLGLNANIAVTLESIIALFSVALTTGLVFARFSRPTARIAYSHHAVVAPYRGISAFMFRCANARNNQLLNVSVRVLYSRMEGQDTVRTRQFTVLPLEFDQVTFFTLSWTVVHPVTPDSPLFGIKYEDLVQNDTEFLVLLSGTDETFAQTVHSQTSYKPEEIVWGAKYKPIFVEAPSTGVIGMDLSKIHEWEPANLPEEPSAQRSPQ